MRVGPVLVAAGDVLRPLLRVQHLHQERRVRRVPLQQNDKLGFLPIVRTLSDIFNYFIISNDCRYCDTRLHVLEVEEVLAALRHHLQVGQQVQKLGEFVLRFREREKMGDQYQLNCACLNGEMAKICLRLREGESRNRPQIF